VIVIDASVAVNVFVNDTADTAVMRARLSPEAVACPTLLDYEVLAALRGLLRGGRIDLQLAGAALRDLAAAPWLRVPPVETARRTFELRANLTTYDASYVAAAEALGCPLLTADARIAAAPGIRCEVELVSVA
jgi:predicted nucleic acid-binding protein